MKPHPANSAVLTARCAHRSPAGRQCRLVASDARSGLCPQHCEAASAKTQADSAPISGNTWDPSLPEPDPRKKPS
jgi:hypothetical protein